MFAALNELCSYSKLSGIWKDPLDGDQPIARPAHRNTKEPGHFSRRGNTDFLPPFMETSASYVIHDAGRSDLTGKSIRCSPRYQRPSPRLKRASVTSILSFCNQKLIGFAFFFSFLLSCICSPVSSVPPPPPGHTAKDDKVESAIFHRSLRPARHCTSKLVSELSH